MRGVVVATMRRRAGAVVVVVVAMMVVVAMVWPAIGCVVTPRIVIAAIKAVRIAVAIAPAEAAAPATGIAVAEAAVGITVIAVLDLRLAVVVIAVAATVLVTGRDAAAEHRDCECRKQKFADHGRSPVFTAAASALSVESVLNLDGGTVVDAEPVLPAWIGPCRANLDACRKRQRGCRVVSADPPSKDPACRCEVFPPASPSSSHCPPVIGPRRRPRRKPTPRHLPPRTSFRMRSMPAISPNMSGRSPPTPLKGAGRVRRARTGRLNT